MIQQTPDRGMIIYLTRAGVPFFFITGTGSPESVEVAPPGSLFVQTDGVKFWQKFSGVGNTGWKDIPINLAGAILGDLLVGNSSGGFDKTGVGSANQLLQVVGGVPAWTTLAAAIIPSGIDAAKISGGSVSNAEFDFLNGVSSAIQTQLNNKAPSSGIDATAISTGTVSSTEFDFLNGLTSGIQAQLDALDGRIAAIEAFFTSAISGTAQLAKLTPVTGNNGAADFSNGLLTQLINPD